MSRRQVTTLSRVAATRREMSSPRAPEFGIGPWARSKKTKLVKMRTVKHRRFTNVLLNCTGPDSTSSRPVESGFLPNGPEFHRIDERWYFHSTAIWTTNRVCTYSIEVAAGNSSEGRLHFT